MTKSHFKGNECPKSLLPLRKEVITLLTDKFPSRVAIRRAVKSYPKAWDIVSTSAYKWSLSKLLELLGLPFEGNCQTCGEWVGLTPNTLRVKQFCSHACVANSPDIQKKKDDTVEAKTGYRCQFQNPELMRKAADEREARTGYRYTMQNPKLMKHIGDVLESKTGYRFPMQNPDMLKAREDGLEERTGYRHAMQNPATKKKVSDTLEARTGFRFPSQNPETLQKQQKYRRKIFTDKRGVKHDCQGYEPFVLQFLDEHPDVLRFTTKAGTQLLPSIRFNNHLRKRRCVYHPDIGVILKDGRHLIIEVKSTYTLWCKEELNKMKFRATSNLCKKHPGWKFWLAVVDKGEITWIG